MRTSILNGFLLGLTHAQDGSDEISNFKIESCNAADKERLSIELLEFKQGMWDLAVVVTNNKILRQIM